MHNINCILIVIEKKKVKHGLTSHPHSLTHTQTLTHSHMENDVS